MEIGNKVKSYAVLYPDIRTIYLTRNHGTCQMRYLALSQSVTEERLREDVRNGAGRFAALEEYLARKRHATYVLVTAPTREEALMAVSYLAAIDAAGSAAAEDGEMNVWEPEERSFPGKDGDGSGDAAADLEGVTADPEDRPDLSEVLHAGYGDGPVDWGEDRDTQTWHETPWQVPIIPGRQVVAKLGSREEDSAYSFGLGSLRMQGDAPGLEDDAPWIVCRHEPVVLDLTGCVPMTSPADISGAIGYFRRNRRVYLILAQESPENDELYALDFGEDEDEERSFERLRSCILLDYLADEVKIPQMKEEERTAYFARLAQSNARTYGMHFAEGFPFEKFLNAVLLPQEYSPCYQLYKVIRYAAVRRLQERENAAELALSDFSFLDHYADLRTQGADSGRKMTALEHLDHDFVGMEHVKKQVKDIITLLRYERLRKEAGLDRGIRTHNVFLMLGAPGTAKSSIARVMGQIMHEENLLPDNRFMAISGAEMKGMYVGHTAPKIHQLFMQYDVLFIDEAYGLAASDGRGPDTFSQEGMAQLCVELEENTSNKLVLFAGYGGRNVTEENNRMMQFLAANPGISSRIRSTIYFDSYTPEELAAIFARMADIRGYRLEGCDARAEEGKEAEGEDSISIRDSAPGIKEKAPGTPLPPILQRVRDYFKTRVGAHDNGNGREVRNLLDATIQVAAGRLLRELEKRTEGGEKSRTELLATLTEADVAAAIEETKKEQGTRFVTYRHRIGF